MPAFRRLNIVVLISILFRMTCCAIQESESVEDAAKPSIELTQENLAEWRQHVLPSQADLVWQQIPWLTTFADGILEADNQDKPLLLWVMNGHPLGCT